MGYIEIDEDGWVSVYAYRVNQAKLALEELTIKKKELQVHKKQIAKEIHQISLSYADSISKQNLKAPDSFIKRFVKDLQILRRSINCKKLRKRLSFYEDKRQGIEAVLINVDDTQRGIEKYILENS